MFEIDQLRRSQQELSRARDFVRSITEGVPLPIVVLDAEFKVRSSNQAFAALSGCSPHHLHGQYFPDLALSLWGLSETLRSRLTDLRNGSDDALNFGFEHKTPGEAPRYFLVRGCLLKPDGDQYFLLTLQDITRRKWSGS